MIKYGDMIEFNSTKHFKHIERLGSGGTGDTHLFEDETTNMLFAIKKYSPKGSNSIEENYKRFVDEIKILFQLSNPNIVRIYNYYLYPEFKVGYLQMEYVEGISIDEFQPDYLGKGWDDVFTQLISAFEYLEKNNILHRDIRPANILIDKNDDVKLIDFGFGKQLTTTEKEGRSVYLNWPVTQLPNEITEEGIYNHQTEIYFLGKMFSHILGESLNDFKFQYIINNMIKINPNDRYSSFNEIITDISKGILGEIDFTIMEKQIYSEFADSLVSHINHYIDAYKPLNDVNLTLSRLVDMIKTSALEEFIQDNSKLIQCFIGGGFSYSTKKDIKVTTVTEFYEFLKELNLSKQRIVLDNIYTRLAKIKVEINDMDLPF